MPGSAVSAHLRPIEHRADEMQHRKCALLRQAPTFGQPAEILVKTLNSNPTELIANLIHILKCQYQ